VDDDPLVLSGLQLHLRRRYDVEVAGSGQAGLDALARPPAAAVVISDMRMPGMNGAEFLAKVSADQPNTTRILLTGHAEVNAAIAAINHGQIFRFLVKPCPPPELLAAVEAGVEMHRLVIAERVLLEETLHGSIQVLSEVLALTNPLAFGRATRVRQIVSDLAEKLALGERWQIEVAAMLFQLGAVVLPIETSEKLYYGTALTPEEQDMAAKVPETTAKLLAHIPRLEGVREILAGYGKPYRPRDPAPADPRAATLLRAAQVLRIAAEFDAFEAQRGSRVAALDALRGRAEQYLPEALEALQALYGGTPRRTAVREVSLAALRVGMAFADDVKMTTGTLLVPRGYEVTASFLARVRNFRAGSVREPVRVVVGAAPER
jgi:FixJ family two-component response regulator